jgi:hypothetical protein
MCLCTRFSRKLTSITPSPFLQPSLNFLVRHLFRFKVRPVQDSCRVKASHSRSQSGIVNWQVGRKRHEDDWTVDFGISVAIRYPVFSYKSTHSDGAQPELARIATSSTTFPVARPWYPCLLDLRLSAVGPILRYIPWTKTRLACCGIVRSDPMLGHGPA